jgi:hypothetical protein
MKGDGIALTPQPLALYYRVKTYLQDYTVLLASFGAQKHAGIALSASLRLTAE